MKFLIQKVVPALCAIVLIVSCEDTDKPAKTNRFAQGNTTPTAFKATFTNGTSRMKLNDTLAIEIAAGDSAAQLAQLFVIQNNDTIFTTRQLPSNTTAILEKTGSTSIVVAAKLHSGRLEQQLYTTVTMSDSKPKQYTYNVKADFAHDAKAYTQGLFVHEGKFFEGTGLYKQSSLRKVEIKNGEIVQRTDLEPQYFGEGITLLNNQIFQITWQEKTCFVYDPTTFALQNKFAYNTEGWGLTNDGNHLIMSDGSHKIYFIRPTDFVVEKTIEVFDNERAIGRINELEYIDGEIWANIYETNLVARINPNSGKLEGVIDFKGILPAKYSQGAEVMNGIAQDPATKKIFVTGKLWPRLFEVEVVEKMN